jgi:dipeptidase D
MKGVLSNLDPQQVFYYFEQISQIPRESGNEKGISDYLVQFAKNHHLPTVQDDALNVVITKPGTSGYENAPTVILQGHMDMVCEKNKDTQHDFEKDPIELKVNGDFIEAQGTTLGADNGIAIAYGLALLASTDIPHPPLEVVITTDEETGMTGVANLDTSNLKGRILINIDSEEEGELLVSCAGGIRTNIAAKCEWKAVPDHSQGYVIQIRNLKGGHSGMEIDKGRANANKLMGRILNDLNTSISYALAFINGGSKDNVIPREMDAVIYIQETEKTILDQKIEEWNQILQNELRAADPNVTVNIEPYTQTEPKVLSEQTKEKVLAILALIPNGIQSMSMDIKGLVESSTNLGVVKTTDTEIRFDSAVRSSVQSLKEAIVAQTKIVAQQVGVDFSTHGAYPAWSYNPDSKIRTLFETVYEKMYGQKPVIQAIHAGVECGFFAEKIGDIDMISFGPNMLDVHSPDERLSISSTKRTWEYLVEVLKEIK